MKKTISMCIFILFVVIACSKKTMNTSELTANESEPDQIMPIDAWDIAAKKLDFGPETSIAWGWGYNFSGAPPV